MTRHAGHMFGGDGYWDATPDYKDPRTPAPTPKSFANPVLNINAEVYKYHCNRSCKWTSEGHKCQRTAEYLRDWFKRHHSVYIVYEQYADKYPECPMFEI